MQFVGLRVLILITIILISIGVDYGMPIVVHDS